MPEQAPEPQRSPSEIVRTWWAGLSPLRRAAFGVGVMMYMFSYEYVHDFGVKRPSLAFLAVAVMIFSAKPR